jgi:hypothetical protein
MVRMPSLRVGAAGSAGRGVQLCGGGVCDAILDSGTSTIVPPQKVRPWGGRLRTFTLTRPWVVRTPCDRRAAAGCCHCGITTT